ncbi:hypothetical protein ACWKSP_25360 [Micromonosporaceae bacterium Da 78-11]
MAVALIALPARLAERTDTFSAEVIAGGYAVIGLLLGLVVAYWAVVSRPVATNLIATAVWLWALAIAAVVVELTLHRSSATYLTSWQFAESGSDHRYGTIYWPSAVLTLGAALLIGIIAAVPAVRRGNLGVGAATSGAVGPLLVAAAFFVLAPQLTGALGPLESAYLTAPYAVISGLAGSALTVAVGQAAANRRARRAALRAEPDAALPAELTTAPDAATGLAIPAAAAVATIPAADPAEIPIPIPTQPSSAKTKTKGQATRNLTAPPAVAGRAKLPTQSGPGQPGPATSGPATSGPATSGPATSGPATSGPATSGPATSGPATSGPGQPGSAHPGLAHPGPGQPSPGQPSPGQPGHLRSRSGQADSAQSGPAQLGTGQPGPDQFGAGQPEGVRSKPASGARPTSAGAANAAAARLAPAPAPAPAPATKARPTVGAQPDRDMQDRNAPASASPRNKPTIDGAPAPGKAAARPNPIASPSPAANPSPAASPSSASNPSPASNPSLAAAVPADQVSIADPEIAAAARRGGARAKKAAPAATRPVESPKSTVTPPPASPTVAQINPKPPTNS